MKRLSKEKLKEMGFVRTDLITWSCGSVFVEIIPNAREMEVYVSSRITSDEDYAQPAVGVKTPYDLGILCHFINGPEYREESANKPPFWDLECRVCGKYSMNVEELFKHYDEEHDILKDN